MERRRVEQETNRLGLSSEPNKMTMANFFPPTKRFTYQPFSKPPTCLFSPPTPKNTTQHRKDGRSYVLLPGHWRLHHDSHQRHRRSHHEHHQRHRRRAVSHCQVPDLRLLRKISRHPHQEDKSCLRPAARPPGGRVRKVINKTWHRTVTRRGSSGGRHLF